VGFGLLVLVLAAGPAAPAAAVIAPSDLPSKARVKNAMDGVGTWNAGPFPRPIGSRPADCRSDRQMLDPDERRVRGYGGREAGRPASVYAEVAIEVFRYGSRAEARAAVRSNGTYPERCPRVTEWTCTECDGISTTWRTLVTLPRVGVQSVAWRYRAIDNFKHKGFTYVARRDTTVVRVSSGRARMPTGSTLTYPRLISAAKAERVARMALRTAMPG
jgi:hypothetical protein